MAMRKKTTKKNNDPASTPMMRQYLSIKDQHPDAIVFYRMGDFYEMFFEDAVVASQNLDLTLTSRDKKSENPIPMCGIPHHASLGYISRLIEKGFKVAVCEQMEDPTQVKGIVKREVVRVITPGVIVEEENLDAKSNNYLVAVFPAQKVEDATDTGQLRFAIAAMDASTNEFKGTQVLGKGALIGELFRLEPREMLVPESFQSNVKDIQAILKRCYITALEDAAFSTDTAVAGLTDVIGDEETSQLMTGDQLLARAAGAIVGYVKHTRPMESVPPGRFLTYDITDHLVIDEATKSHLELTQSSEGSKKGSLLWLLDKTQTPMGGRALRNRINYPLFNADAINQRLDAVELFFNDSQFRSEMRGLLGQIADVERIATRISMGAATPRDMGTLRDSLTQLPELQVLLTSCPDPRSEALFGDLDTADDLWTYLQGAFIEEPPVSKTDGAIFKPGFNTELDDYVHTVSHAKDFLTRLEQSEREKTGISSLKVSYNKVVGYFIFVTKSNLKSVPTHYIRKQTLVNGERFVTEELEEWESKVLTAEEKRKSLEKELFIQLVAQMATHGDRLMAIASRVASIDCACALGEVARVYEYVRPTLNKKGIVDIKEGRHPLVETVFSEEAFVPNDTLLDNGGERFMMITGPNMAGKSTVMRQVALICVMAQMGSFVPAVSASVSLVDRLFTRVGASDNIARGSSTFMVEMNETSAILRGATADSLVILDEVGRGTSTFDGLSIAWSVGEYLHDVVRCKTMFATHYHELVELANVKPHAANYHVAAREYGEDVVFLRKLIKGGTSHSFGIQVAKMAGLPELVVARSREILQSLEDEAAQSPGAGAPPKQATKSPQLDLFAPAKESEVEKVLRDIDVNRITPMEAMSLLMRLKDML